MEYWIIGMSGMLLTIVGVGVIACLMLKASHEKP